MTPKEILEKKWLHNIFFTKDILEAMKEYGDQEREKALEEMYVKIKALFFEQFSYMNKTDKDLQP